MGTGVVIAHVHPFRQLSSLFSEGEDERLVREIAELTFNRSVSTYLQCRSDGCSSSPKAHPRRVFMRWQSAKGRR